MMAREVRIERRGARGLSDAEIQFLAGNIPEPTTEALDDYRRAPALAAAASTQEIGEQVAQNAAALLARYPEPRTVTYADAQAVGGVVDAVAGDDLRLVTLGGSFTLRLPAGGGSIAITTFGANPVLLNGNGRPLAGALASGQITLATKYNLYVNNLGEWQAASLDADLIVGSAAGYAGLRDRIGAGLPNYIPLTKFGIDLNSTVDQSSKLQAAINSGEALFFPPGAIWLGDGVDLKTQTLIHGSNPFSSLFRALPGATAPMFTHAAGQIRYLTLRDFGVNGNRDNTGQRGFFFHARALNNDPGGGGTWQALLDNIRVVQVDGVQMAWLGGTRAPGTIASPHQWAVLRMVQMERPYTASDLSLYMHGQCEHFHFDTCKADGNGSGTVEYGGQNIYVGRSFAAQDGLIGAYGTGTALTDWAPKTVLFTNLTCQAADQAIVIDRAENVVFTAPWFEDNKNSIKTQVSARVAIESGRFADAATAANGRAIAANSLSEVTVDGNTVFGGVNFRGFWTDGSGSIMPSGRTGNPAAENLHHVRTFNSNDQIEMGIAPGLQLSAAVDGLRLQQFGNNHAVGTTVMIRNNGTRSFELGSAGSGTFGVNLGVAVDFITVLPGEIVHLMKAQNAGGKGWNFLNKI